MLFIDSLLASTISPIKIGKIRDAKLDNIKKTKPSIYADLLFEVFKYP